MSHILAVASGGGHWVQLRRLFPAFTGFDTAIVTVSKAYVEQAEGRRFHVVTDAHRLKKWRFLRLAFQAFFIIVVERPRIVITTGSAPGLACIVIAKLLLRSRTMWIDSIANCETLSSSGRIARRFSDVWLTQHPDLETKDGPHYWGSVL